MLTDGLVLAEGTAITNAVVAKGTAFPSSPDMGELFFRSDIDALHVYNGTAWIQVGLTSALLEGHAGAYFLDNANATGVMAVVNGGTGVTTYPALVTALGLDIGTNVQAFDADLAAIAAIAGTTGLLKKTAANTWVLDTAAYITGNQPITLSGDVSGTGNTNITVTLATVGTAGTYKSVTVNDKGLVTAGTNPTTLAGYGITDAQPLDADLTAIAALTGSAGNLRSNGAGIWSVDTNTYLKNNGDTFTGTLTMTGDILPSASNLYSLGSATMVWKDIWVGPGSLYLNGKEVISDRSDTMTFSTDLNQNLRIQTTGTGVLELESDIGGSISIRGTLSMASGKRIVDSAGIKVEFGADIELNTHKIIGLGTPTLSTDAATKGYVDGLTTSDATIVRTAGDQTIAGNKTFSGNVTINGTFTSNATSVMFADNILEFNSDFTVGTPTEDAGFQVRRGDAGIVKFIWEEATDRFVMMNGVGGYLDLYTTGTITAGTFSGNATSATALSTGRTFSVSGDATGTSAAFTGAADASIPMTLATVNASPTTAGFHKITTNGKGLVTASTAVVPGDITSALGYTPLNKAGDTMSGLLVLSGDPVTGFGAVTKQYVDNAVNGLSWKNSVRLATTANITLSGTQTIDGILVFAGDRVLVKNQTASAQNGVYIAAAGAWARATDFDATPSAGEVNGAAVFVQGGTVGGDTSWVVTSNVVTIDTDPITFAQFSGGAAVTAGANVTLTGNVLSLNTTLTGLTSVTSTDFVGTLTGAAPAGSLSGSTLAAGVTASSLTSVGTLSSLTVSGTITGSLSGAASLNVLKSGDTMTGALNISGGGGTNTSGKFIDLVNGTGYDLFFLPRNTAGGYNTLNQAGDAYIGYSAGGIDTGALVIGPWSAAAKGIRIDVTGMVSIGTATNLNTGTGLTGGLNVNGIITAGSTISTSGSLILAGYYGALGATTTFGSEFSTGGAVIGYAVRPSTAAAGAFTSTVGTSSLTRGALTIAGDTLTFYNGATQVAAVGAAATMAARLTVNTGAMTYTGNNLYVNGSANLIIQHDSTSGYIRAQNAGAHLYLGAQAVNTMDIAANAVTITGTLGVTSTSLFTNSSTWVSGTGGSVIVQPGDATHSGYVNFYAPSSGPRQGYIGYSTTTAATDTGTLNYIAATHSFSGSIIGNTTGTHTGAVVGTTGSFSSTLSVSGVTTLAANQYLNIGSGHHYGSSDGSTTNYYFSGGAGGLQIRNQADTALIVLISDTGAVTAASFSGSGAGLTSLPAGQLTGTLPNATVNGGTYTMNITGNAGTATSTTSAARASVLIQTDGTTSQTPTDPRGSIGSRATTIAPNAYAFGLFSEFKNSGSMGDTAQGSYSGLITYANHIGTTASTGDPSYQLLFSPAAANSTAAPRLMIRAGIDTTWGGWSTFLHSGNFNSYAPTLTGTGASGTWGISITGAAPYSGITGIPLRGTWASIETSAANSFVAGQLGWKNYGNNHTIFDASAGTAPDGTAVNNTNPQIAWAGSYPNLMGWNGSQTYGVRVHSANIADNSSLLGGYAANTTIVGSTIPVRDSNGYLFNSYFNGTDEGTAGTAGTVTGILAKRGDNYYRTTNAASIATFISGQSMNISGTATNATNVTGGNIVGSKIVSSFNGAAAAQGQAGDIITRRSASTGVVYFGDSPSVYLYYDGTNFNFGGGSVIASTFTGTLSGNATSATTATSATNATNATYSSVQNQSGGNSNWDTMFSNTLNGGRNWAENSSGGPSGTWWFTEDFRHTNGAGVWGRQHAWGWEDNAHEFYTRNVSGGVWSGWVRFLSSNNYNSFAPTLTGGNASGTWGISITGNAATATTATNATNVTGVAQTLGYSTASVGIATGGVGGPQVMGSTTNAAMISFHRAGAYAVNFGLDTDNQLKVGGWSAGGASVILHSSNYTSYAPSLTGGGASGTWGINISGSSAGCTGNSATVSMSSGRTDATAYPVVWGVPSSASQLYSCSAVAITSSTGLLSASSLYATGEITAFSDARVKTDIELISNALEKVEAIRGVTYTRTDAPHEGVRQAGVIAQEVELVLPEVVKTNEDGMKSVAYGNLTALLIEAVKELSAQNKALLARLEILEGK